MRICLSSYVVHSYVELGYREMYRMTSCWVVARGARGQKEAAPKQDDVFALLLIYFSHFEERPGEISRQRPSADGGRPRSRNLASTVACNRRFAHYELCFTTYLASSLARSLNLLTTSLFGC